MQRSMEPAAITTYEISFTPVNPLPPDGAIQIAWPDNIELTTSITCTVVTNKAWENKCNIEPDKLTITINDVFSETTDMFVSPVTVTMVGVNNPKNNKEKGRGFLINTYADSSRTYRVDYLPANYMVPILECDYPCRTCLASDRSFCQTCWLQEWSERKYFYEDQNTDGTCIDKCPDGYSRDNEPNYVCLKCDISCATCKDEDKDECDICAPNYPYRVSGKGFCLEDCSRGFYETTESLTCAKCDDPCDDCEGDSKFCTACNANSEFPVLFNN